jgi:hypothetical protein
MSLRKNTALRTSQASHFGSLWNLGTLQIRTGSQPADPNSAASGTLLCTISLPATAFGTASAGAVGKTGTWQGVASASGTAGWGRLISSDGTKTMDVSIGAGQDCTIDYVDITIGSTITVNTLTLTVPSGV